jgi:hypothetical protein
LQGCKELAGNQDFIAIADGTPTLPLCTCSVTPFLAIEYSQAPPGWPYIFRYEGDAVRETLQIAKKPG